MVHGWESDDVGAHTLPLYQDISSYLRHALIYAVFVIINMMMICIESVPKQAVDL